MDFNTAWVLTYTNSALAFVQTVGCIFIIFAFLTSSRQLYWQIVFAHAISGILGTAIENIYIAKQMCCRNENWSILLGINEICWIIHEATTVAYSVAKLEIAVANRRIKLLLRMGLGLLLVPFAFYRIQIGLHRVRLNMLDHDVIAKAHSNAFVFWGIADLVVFSLLLLNTYQKVSPKFAASSAYQALLGTSIPKLLVISINTILIVIFGQLRPPIAQDWVNLNHVVWAIKGTYPVSPSSLAYLAIRYNIY
jgi:hypothetical protein